MAECRRDPDLVLDAFRFVGESRIRRAEDLRAYEGLTVETILRHLPEYAELWRIHGDRASSAPARASPNGHRFGHAGDGVLEEMWREHNPSSEVYSGE